jgi:PAS domain S-box-containing protein
MTHWGIVEDIARIDGEEARRLALLAAIPDLMFRLRRDGTYLEFAGDISGLATPADELVGSKLQDILPEAAAARLLAAVAHALGSESPVTTEYPLHRLADGALRRFEARVVPVAGTNDEVVAIVRDVTDEWQLTHEQDALRRVATLVASGAGEAELVSAIARELGDLFDADNANALRWDGEALHVIGEWHRDGREPAGRRVYAFGGDTIAARVIGSSAPARVDSYDDLQTDFARDRWRGLDLGASIGAPVRVRGEVWGIVTASRDPDREAFPEGAERRLEDFAMLLAQAIENAEARREMAHLLAEQSALRHIATLVAGGRPPDEVLGRVTSDVGRLFDARGVVVVRWEGTPNEAIVVAGWAAGAARPPAAGSTVRGAPGTAMIDVLETGFASASLGTEASVAAPLIINGVLRGALVAQRAPDAPFPAGAEGRLRAFADLAAQSIGNDIAQRAVRESRARVVREGDEARRRLERNLHDGAQQRLVAVSMTLRYATKLLDTEPERARELLASAETELTHALQDLRDLARGLHPAILSDQGLGAALRALAMRAPGDTVLENEIDARLPDAVEAALYYCASEALTNAAKYARSESVRVAARVVEGSAILEVSDSGPGGARVTPGSGLQGLLDRVEAIGGRLDVHSPVGLGTTVRAVVPLAP